MTGDARTATVQAELQRSEEKVSNKTRRGSPAEQRFRPGITMARELFTRAHDPSQPRRSAGLLPSAC